MNHYSKGPISREQNRPEARRHPWSLVPTLIFYMRSSTVDPARQRDWTARLRSGDTAVFELIYRAYHLVLWKYAYQFVHSRDAAQDIVQDVFVDLWDRRETLEIRKTLEAYLFIAVRNRAMDVVRHETRIAQAAESGEIGSMAGVGEASPG